MGQADFDILRDVRTLHQNVEQELCRVERVSGSIHSLIRPLFSPCLFLNQVPVKK